MKQRLLASAIVMLGMSISISAQKIKTSEIDKFEKVLRIETTEVRIPNAFMLSYRSVDKTIFLKIVRGEPMVVTPESKLIFLLDNDKVVEVYATDIQSSKYSGASSYNSFTGHFEYKIDSADIVQLRDNSIVSVRMFTTDDYKDMDISPGGSTKVNKVSEIFLIEYNKHFR